MSDRLPLALCQFGMAWTTGLATLPDGRRCHRPMTPVELLDFAAGLGLAGVEVSPDWISRDAEPDAAWRCFGEQAAQRGMAVIVGGPTVFDLMTKRTLESATALGAATVRCVLSRVLCGRRSTIGGLAAWRELLGRAASALRELAPRLEDAELKLAIENHQDADSRDLVELCERAGSESVGVCLDTGNPLAVGEPIDAFAQRVAPYVRHAHLKDYRLFHRPNGYCLARCALGDGVVDFAAILRQLTGRVALPSIELAALVGREIPVLDLAWWADLGERGLAETLPLFRLWHERGEPGSGATPFELEDADGLEAYERGQVAASVAYLRGLLED